MKNRLLNAFAHARRLGRKVFSAYVTLGYPTLGFTQRFVNALEDAGVDILELGFPFSDPLADGPVIQHASEVALRKAVTLDDAFRLGRRLRKESSRLALVFFSYYNPILQRGLKRFANELAASGFDGLISPDLPPDEDTELAHLLREKGIAVIYLAAPTTDPERLRLIAHRSTGFIYYVSLKGVTGMRKMLSRDLASKVRAIKRLTRKPVLIGFGVSNPAQARAAARLADGVIVGSAIVDAISKSGGKTGKVVKFVRALARAIRPGRQVRAAGGSLVRSARATRPDAKSG
jgi:tryptophan synthase alpha chain